VLTVSKLGAILIKLSLRPAPEKREQRSRKAFEKRKKQLTKKSESDILIKHLKMGKPSMRGVGSADRRRETSHEPWKLHSVEI